METNLFKIDNRLILSKWYYSGLWFNRILESKQNDEKALLIDRCPLETAAYVTHSDLLFPALISTFKELEDLGFKFIFIYIKSSYETLKARILNRIESEPERISYNELNDEHNKRAFDFYKKNESLWNYTIENESLLEDPLKVLEGILQLNT